MGGRIMNVCQECHESPVYIKKSQLCRKCYYERWRKKYKQGDYHPHKAGPNIGASVGYHVKKYGMRLLFDFTRPKLQWGDLSDFGRRYGFSREYARQLYNKFKVLREGGEHEKFYKNQ
jgi:hypothetical protein